MAAFPRVGPCRFLLAVGLLALAAPPSAAREPHSPVVTTPNKQILAVIDARARAAISKGETAGLAVAIVKDGRTVFARGYGLADVSNGVAVTNKTVFRAGSLTKQMTATAVLRLVEQRALRLDDSLAAYLPEFPGAADMTIRQLLQHTAGIRNFTAVPGAAAKDLRVDRSTSGMVDYIAALPNLQEFKPGIEWRYSNSGYVLLGAVIEKVTGRPLGRYFAESLFGELTLPSVVLDDGRTLHLRMADGYVADREQRLGFTSAPFVSMTAPGGAGALAADAIDLARWQQALLFGKVLNPASLAAMTAPARLADGRLPERTTRAGAAFRNVGYGMGIEIGDFAGRRVIGHAGAISGFGSALYTFTDTRVTYAVLANTSGATDAIAADIARAAARVH